MGVIVAASGPILELLTRRFGISLPVAGATISVHFAGGLIGVLVTMRAMERLAGRTSVMVATGLTGLGCFAVALAPVWPAFLGAVFVVGLGFGSLVIGLNQLVAYSEGPRRAALLSPLNSPSSAPPVCGPLAALAPTPRHS